MSSILEQLQDSNAVALMYLGGELGEEDRLEVERLLAIDPALRAEVEMLRAMQMRVEGVLARWDQTSPAALSQEASVRQISRTMTRWLLDERAARRSLRLLGWAYPLAAAAMIALSCGLWWHYHQRVSTVRGPVAVPLRVADSGDNAKEQQEEALARCLFASDPATQTVELDRDLRQTGDLFGNDW